MTLVAGTGAGLALTYLARPVLTRLYTPEEFGLLGFFIALTALLSTISTGRYEDALLTPKDRDEAANVLVLSGWLALATSFLALAFLAGRTWFARILGEPAIAPFLGLVAPAVLALSGARLAETWLTRGSRFAAVSRARIVQSGVAAPAQMSAGWAGAGTGGLVYGLLLGQLSAAVYLVAQIVRVDRRVISSVSRAGLAAAARRFRRFPQYSLPAALLNASALHLPALLLFGFYDASVVGFYAQAYGLLAAPIGLVGSAVTQVFFVRAAESSRSGELGADTEAVFSRLLRVGAFPLLCLCLIGPDVFALVLGEPFREAGVYAQYLAPWALVLFVSSPLTRLYDVLERQRSFFIYNTVSFSTRLIVLMVAGTTLEARSAIALYAVAGALLSAGQAIWLLRIGHARPGAVGNALASAAVPTLPGLAAVYGLVHIGAPVGVVLGTAALISLAYVALFLRSRHRRT